MAKKKVHTIQANQKVKLKTYMYAIRPVLCCEWIIKHSTQPPMDISDLMNSITENKIFKNKVIDFITEKQEHSEGYMVDRSEVIDNYIHTKILQLHSRIPKNPKRLEAGQFDDVFRYILSNTLP